MSSRARTKLTNGLTFTAFLAGLLCLLLLSIATQFGEVVLRAGFLTEHSLPLPIFWIFFLLLAVTGAVKLVSRIVLLSRAEKLCILYAMLIAAPLTTQGFWHRIVAIIATNPRAGDFEKMDAFNDKLWPHGPNVVFGYFGKDHQADLVFSGGHRWERIEFDKGQTAELPVLTNAHETDHATVRIKLPVRGDSGPVLACGEPYLVSVLLKAENLGPGARYFCRLYADQSNNFSEVFSSNLPPRATALHQTGFQRVGAYGATLPVSTTDYAYLEIGLQGPGKLALVDPRMFSVATLEQAYKGRLIVSQSEYNQQAKIPGTDLSRLVVRPDSLWNREGVKYLLSGYIPIRDWITPMFSWISFVMLILLGTLALVSIMRRQWVENEHYSLPMTRVPEALIGTGEPGSIFGSSLTWIGLGFGIIYAVWRAAAFYNAKIPDPTISVLLRDYISDPSWGTMFTSVRFEINLIFLSLCVFMELNILFSLVAGFWLFKTQGWVGQFTRWNVNPSYPYSYDQTLVSYMTYGVLVVILSRRYVMKVIQAAIVGDSKFSEGEAMSYRSAVLMLAGVFVGCGLWAAWMGIGVPGMLLFFTYLLLVGFVSAKFRAEAGLAWGYFSPGNFALLMTLFGGIPIFGASAVMFCYVASFFLAPTVFFLIPGAQLELLELGRKENVPGRQLIAVVVLGILGGLLVGGWVFLSNAYSLGGETLRYGWAFDTKSWYFRSYNQQMIAAGKQAVAQTSGVALTGFDPVWYAYGFAAIGTVVVTLLGQMFAGFPLHPIGFVLGSTAGTGGILDFIWGSALVAWVIRGGSLWLGGAAVVRQKLQPLFIGIFLGAAFGELLTGVYGMHLKSLGIERIFEALTPP